MVGRKAWSSDITSPPNKAEQSHGLSSQHSLGISGRPERRDQIQSYEIGNREDIWKNTKCIKERS